MLRVAMITDFAASTDRVDGGVQAVTRYLVDALVRHGGLELHLVGFDYGVGQSRSSTVEGYEKHVLRGSSGGALTAYYKDQRTLNHLLDRIRPGLVHGQGAGQNGILAVRSGLPSVITIHGILAEEANFYTGFAKRLRQRLLSLWSNHYCIRRGRHTILISPYVADYFEGRLAGHQYLIPNPIADEFFDVERADNGCRVLFAGRLYALKGVVDLVRATARLAGTYKFDVVLAGSLHDRNYVAQLREEADRLDIGDRVEFRGLLDEDELRRELGRSAALVLPSYQETAPLVISEAMAAGVPVIASDVGGVRYQVRHGETGFLITPGDVDGLAQRLGELLSDPARRASFGQAAKRLAASNHRATNVAARTIEVYRTVLD